MNCKPGDWAIVVPPAHSENIGCIVMVIREPTLDEDAMYGPPWEPSWIVGSRGRRLALVDSRGRKEFVHTRLYADACLRPISGLPDTEDTDTEQPIKEVA